MILQLQHRVHDALTSAIRSQYGLADVPAFAIETPPNRAMGDMAVTVAFQLARTLRKAPRAIAQELAGALAPIPGVDRIVAAPNGYLNLFIDRPRFMLDALGGGAAPSGTTQEKVVVEHTAINPNKAAHIGHLRNSTTGDAFGRLLRFQGREVEIQNYNYPASSGYPIPTDRRINFSFILAGLGTFSNFFGAFGGQR